MNRVFYLVAVLVAVALLVIGVMASRNTTKQTDTNNGGDSFNTDQLQDATDKTPVAN